MRNPFMSKQAHDVRQQVRQNYAKAALSPDLAADEIPSNTTGCCSPDPRDNGAISRELGYSETELADSAEGSNLGLGCGNPQAIAALQSGETVLDLGSGAGFDAFLAARKVGETGKVIGVDMTPEMLSRARENVEKTGLHQVEFRLGEIEALPLADAQVDVIISNCVINLSPEKQRVFDESFRVLKSGGRLAISDVVLTADVPDEVMKDAGALSACVSGARPHSEIRAMLEASGFESIEIGLRGESSSFISEWLPGHDASEFLVSATIEARKPASKANCC